MNNNTVNVTFPFFSILGIVFIGLKLANIITWPWVWVLAPIWIPASIGIIFLLFWLLIVAIIAFNNR